MVKTKAMFSRKEFEEQLRLSKSEQLGIPLSKVRLTQSEKRLARTQTTFKPNGKIFTKTSDSSFFVEDSAYNVSMEEDVKTFKILKDNKKKKFIIYELPRKQQPRRIKTISMNKNNKTSNDVIKNIQQEKISIKNKKRTFVGKSEFGGEVYVVQTNYKSDTLIRAQLVGLVKVTDTRRDITAHFIGYSKKLNTPRPSQAHINKAKIEIINHALYKFGETFGKPYKSDDVNGIIIKIRYQYYEHTKTSKQRVK